MKEHAKDRCRGCGGRIGPNDDVVKVTSGNISGRFKKKDTWGYMHRHCFLVAVGDPQAIFAVEPATAA